ncbi:MAG: HlyC/CorC family transporter [Deltaproteobacteria bacterium]|nr:HlyC/CorC family transporter [Candidatus Anaeroferrophillus wilburensis]MBN2888011.1 HlyC/CorC family transporter [Deltaproteobacteria bacterium]
MIIKILTVLFIILVNAFFVAAEFALVKLSSSEVAVLARGGSRTAKAVESIVGHLDAYLSACQLGITLASLALGWVGEPLVARLLEPAVHLIGLPVEKVHYIALPLAFSLITFLHITVGEQAPKILAIQRHQPTALFVALPLLIFRQIFMPFIWALNAFSNRLLRFVGLSADEVHSASHTEEELRHILLESTVGGLLKPRERRLMENVMDLEEKYARRYMVPRNQIVYLDLNDSLEEKLRRAADSGHTRLPLCDGDIDHIVGVVHVKDIFQLLATDRQLVTLRNLSRKAVYLPENIHLDVLLLEFQRRKVLMALLVDEYGSVSGMITLENVLEELVGPIEDEFDHETPFIIRTGTHSFVVNALCPADEVAKTCLLVIPDDITSDTIGGVVVELLGRIPVAGEVIPLGSHEIAVREADQRRVIGVEIRPAVPAGPVATPSPV